MFFFSQNSGRPRSLLFTVSAGAIQTPRPGSDPGPVPGPIPGPKWSRPDSPCALFYIVSGPHPAPEVGAIPARPGPHPGPERFVQDRGLDGPKQTSWPLLKNTGGKWTLESESEARPRW